MFLVVLHQLNEAVESRTADSKLFILQSDAAVLDLALCSIQTDIVL